MTDDFAGAATKGAAACRRALAEHRGTPAPTTKPRERSLVDLLGAHDATPARTPAPSPLATPEPAWTPHDAMPATASPGHWADGTPIPDEDLPEEYR